MSSMTKRARDQAGKFASGNATSKPASSSKRQVGRPRSGKKKQENPVKTFEVSITVSVGGQDVNKDLLSSLQWFLVDKVQAGKCSLERGGAAFHLHFQMVARLEATSMIAISKMVKSYLGWDKHQPIGGIVMCKKLMNKGLHTFYGLLGYCMKDAGKDHFETVDHNVSAEDLRLGLGQYALHGREENKNRIMLTASNLVHRVYMWRRFNCKHPSVVDFDRDLYEMLKTGKYYPAASWVIAGSGKGYDPVRMQSLYKVMVTPQVISRQDVANVFIDGQLAVSRKEWFQTRWEEKPPRPCKKGVPARAPQSSFQEVEDMNLAGRMRVKVSSQEITEVVTITAEPSSGLDALCEAALAGIPATCKDCRRKRAKRSSPTRDLWPEEWNMQDTLNSSSSSEECKGSGNVMPGAEYIPLYTRTSPLLEVS